MAEKVMYYRRKILLSLLEVFDGRLGNTDCQKLLFLFCQQTGKDYYNFFPYKYGGFSLIAYQDKNRLIDLGFLADSEDFKLCARGSFLRQLSEEDRLAMEALHGRFRNQLGRKLIRHVYLNYPRYASRSKIVFEVLRPNEIREVQRSWNSGSSSAIFTIGYEGLTCDAYLDKLLHNNIKALVDVRKNPISMKYGFSKTKLSTYTDSVGIKYFHVPELGIPSHLRKELDSDQSYQKLFDHYATQILLQQEEKVRKIIYILHEHGRIALTCFEKDHRYCHRQKITEYLEKSPNLNARIVHI
ncbi:DUF488 domain-containing protein [bacterium]|nr:DUF488 domain-containing protein [bacterium]